MFCGNNSCCCFTTGINDLAHHFALDIASSKNTGYTGVGLFVCGEKLAWGLGMGIGDWNQG